MFAVETQKEKDIYFLLCPIYKVAIVSKNNNFFAFNDYIFNSFYFDVSKFFSFKFFNYNLYFDAVVIDIDSFPIQIKEKINLYSNYKLVFLTENNVYIPIIFNTTSDYLFISDYKKDKKKTKEKILKFLFN